MTNDQMILDALGKLDVLDESQWTAQGLPKVEVVAEMTGLPDVKRKDIDAALPGFSRSNPIRVDVSNDAPVESEPPQSERQMIESEMADVRGEIATLQRRELALQVRLDELVSAEKPQTTVEAIQSYIETAHENRKREAEQRQSLIASGFPPRMLPSATSAIDRAMANRRPNDRPRITP